MCVHMHIMCHCICVYVCTVWHKTSYSGRLITLVDYCPKKSYWAGYFSTKGNIFTANQYIPPQSTPITILKN